MVAAVETAAGRKPIILGSLAQYPILYRRTQETVE